MTAGAAWARAAVQIPAQHIRMHIGKLTAGAQIFPVIVVCKALKLIPGVAKPGAVPAAAPLCAAAVYAAIAGIW